MAAVNIQHTLRMPKTTRAVDVEAGSPPESPHHATSAPRSGGWSFAALAVFALLGVGGTAGAVFYIHTQLSALQLSFDKQRQQTDDMFAQHVKALQELDRAQQEVRKLAGMASKVAPKAKEGEEGEDRRKRRKGAKEAKTAKAKAKEGEDEAKEVKAKGKGKKAKDEEGEDEEKDEVGQHWASIS